MTDFGIYRTVDVSARKAMRQARPTAEPGLLGRLAIGIAQALDRISKSSALVFRQRAVVETFDEPPLFSKVFDDPLEVLVHDALSLAVARCKSSTQDGGKRKFCIRAVAMYYKIDRTFLTGGTGKYERAHDSLPYLVPADNAHAAALAFITDEKASLVGSITSLPGDKATATAEVSQRVYVIFIERADEAIRPG